MRTDKRTNGRMDGWVEGLIYVVVVTCRIVIVRVGRFGCWDVWMWIGMVM